MITSQEDLLLNIMLIFEQLYSCIALTKAVLYIAIYLERIVNMMIKR